MKIFLILLTVLTFFNPSLIQAATEHRTALVIGNSDYQTGRLRNPTNDADAMAVVLKKLGFSVVLKENANRRDMREAILDFGKQLRINGGVGLFYYAGHGIQIDGANYLIPINALIEKELDVELESISLARVFREMEYAENRINIVILDACRDNPFSRSFRNTTRGLAIIGNAPSGTFVSYSTGPNQVARDGNLKHSPYTKALLDNITKPELSINQVFMNVRNTLKKETGQVPWELSSLDSDIFFVPVSRGKRINKIASSASVPSVEDKLEEEKRKLEEAERILESEKVSYEKEKALREKLKTIEEERKQLASKRQAERKAEIERKPIKSIVALGDRKERFVTLDDYTVFDTQTKLMWASEDNGENINWVDAKSYCENFRGGGYSDWRLPTLEELAGLYDDSLAGYEQACGSKFGWVKLTDSIYITCCCVWASEMDGSRAEYFNFHSGNWNYKSPSNHAAQRALPVRSAK